MEMSPGILYITIEFAGIKLSSVTSMNNFSFNVHNYSVMIQLIVDV